MRINCCGNKYFFSGKNQNNNSDKRPKNVALGAFCYMTMCAIYPHNYEKLVDKIDINFKNLPVKDKAKNIAKFALPFFGYPTVALGALYGVVRLIQGFENNRSE